MYIYNYTNTQTHIHEYVKKNRLSKRTIREWKPASYTNAKCQQIRGRLSGLEKIKFEQHFHDDFVERKSSISIYGKIIEFCDKYAVFVCFFKIKGY